MECEIWSGVECGSATCVHGNIAVALSFFESRREVCDGEVEGGMMGRDHSCLGRMPRRGTGLTALCGVRYGSGNARKICTSRSYYLGGRLWSNVVRTWFEDRIVVSPAKG